MPRPNISRLTSSRKQKQPIESKYEAFKAKPASQGKWREASVKPILPSICVDAACSGAPGKLEYRGVYTESQEEIFRFGPFPDGTNNVGEFLAIVHALTWLVKQDKQLPVYSDSGERDCLGLYRKCRTNLKHTSQNAPLFVMIHSAENWLAENELEDDEVLKWDTELWGENQRTSVESRQVHRYTCVLVCLHLPFFPV